jgi:hypothetical protein
MKLKIASRSLFVVCKSIVSLRQTAILNAQPVIGRNISHDAVFFGQVTVPFGFCGVIHHFKLALRGI